MTVKNDLPTTGNAHIYLYGSAFNDDYLVRDPISLPRYGHLARKVMMHYAGDCYNPHIHGFLHEPSLREMIHEIIAYKVLYKTRSYDWEWIDHSFRKYVGSCLGLNLTYEQSRIDAGFKAGSKTKQLINWSQTH